MIKKIAVVISGQPRQLKKSSEFIKPFFDLSSLGVKTDYFLHLWSDIDIRTEGGLNRDNAVNVGRLESLVGDIYDPVFLKIEEQGVDLEYKKLMQSIRDCYPAETNQSPSFKLCAPFLQHFVDVRSHFPRVRLGQFESAARACRQLPVIEEKSGEKYDIVFRIRSDVAFQEYNTLPARRLAILNYFKSLLDSEHNQPLPVVVSYIKMRDGLTQCGDHVFIGTSDSMLAFQGNSSVALVDFFKTFLDRCSKGYFGAPDSIVSLRHPPEACWFHSGFINRCTLFPHHLKPAPFYSIVRDSVRSEDTFDDIDRKWRNIQQSNKQLKKVSEIPIHLFKDGLLLNNEGVFYEKEDSSNSQASEGNSVLFTDLSPHQIEYLPTEEFKNRVLMDLCKGVVVHKCSTQIEDGDWDLQGHPIKENEYYNHMISFLKDFSSSAHLTNNDIETHSLYDFELQSLTNKKECAAYNKKERFSQNLGNSWGGESEIVVEDFIIKKIQGFFKLFHSIKVRGFLNFSSMSSRQLHDLPSANPVNWGPITVSMGREKIFLQNNGFHRVAICQFLNIKTVPVKVIVIHEDRYEEEGLHFRKRSLS